MKISTTLEVFHPCIKRSLRVAEGENLGRVVLRRTEDGGRNFHRFLLLHLLRGGDGVHFYGISPLGAVVHTCTKEEEEETAFIGL